MAGSQSLQTPTIPATGSVNCANCGTPLQGVFCYNCGQHALEDRPTFRGFLRGLVEEFTVYDSKLFRTLRLLWWRPGRLTEDYFAGHRVSYLAPLRLYLSCSLIFFLVSNWMSRQTDQAGIIKLGGLEKTDNSASLDSARVAVAQFFDTHHLPGKELTLRQLNKNVENRNSFRDLILEGMPTTIFLLVPFAALLLMPLYRRNYLEHLIFDLHINAFSFCLILLTTTCTYLAQLSHKGIFEILSIILLMALPVYVLLAIKRFYKQGWGKTVFKFTVYSFFYLILFILGSTMLALIVFYTL